MNNFMNDPLGALSQANQALKQKAAETAESIKQNEDLKRKLAAAKEKASTGLNSASTYAGSAASSLKSNA